MESPSGRPPPRRIKCLLVANRGEIATRIVAAAREISDSIETFTLYTPSDDSHTLNSTRRIQLASPSSYVDIAELIRIAKQCGADAVHPGYGFLSESAEFARRMWDEAGVHVIGPGWDVLDRTGDKVKAKGLAMGCRVPVLEATDGPVDVEGAREFMSKLGGKPVMVKAVDGGGGRGIRLARDPKDLPRLTKLAMAESPSNRVFVERAAVDGFRHIEVQIIGDGTGAVQHLWERECSIQRRYQKVVEMAPSSIQDRAFVGRIINAAMLMAKSICYFSLGTFEFLANPQSGEFFFLEINPRLQVEHTITESITGVDLVQAQLRISQGERLEHDESLLGIHSLLVNELPPSVHAIQFRLTAENLDANWSLSVGKITSFNLPSGNGVRVDTSLVSGHASIVSSDFDSLLAKIIVTARTWEEVVRKSRRALADTHISGVRTNLDVLRDIAASSAFEQKECDTEWLEAMMPSLMRSGREIPSSNEVDFFNVDAGNSTSGGQGLSSTVLFRKGDAWSITLTPRDSTKKTESIVHHLRLDQVLRNEFPSLLLADIYYTTPSFTSPRPYRLQLSATTASSASIMSDGKYRKGDPANPNHIVIPFPGKLVEVLVDEDDRVHEGDVVCVIQQMKMELEVRSPRGGVVTWVTEAKDGEDVAEGLLVAELANAEVGKSRL